MPTARSIPGRPLRRAIPICAVLLLVPLQTAGRRPGNQAPPPDLRGTGLYADFAAKTVAPGNLAYVPQYPLWSDGASKLRWIRLPPGTRIDVSNPDAWVFPVGTKVWKEFSFDGRRVETRLMESTAPGQWRFASYAWDADGNEAVLVPASGLRGVVEIAPGIRHDIPGVLDCRACHEGVRTEVLGFGALQLSPDRDPGAPNAEAPVPGEVDLGVLVDRGLLRHAPAEWALRPPHVDAPTGTGRAALGYLHANCGNCHDATGPLAARGVLLRHSVASSGAAEPALATTVNRPGRYRIPGAEPGSTWLIRPGDPEHSSVWYRMATRNPFRQMPPLATRRVDDEATNLVRRWIAEDLPRQFDPPKGGRGVMKDLETSTREAR